MIFLTSEHNVLFNEDKIIFFYSSDILFLWNELLFNNIKHIEENNNIDILCIDLHRFGSFINRFDISEIPTLIFLDSGREVKRMVGISAFTNTQDIFANA